MIMKKNLLTMLAAILFCGFTVTTLSACSSDDDNKTETPQEQAVKMFYVVEVSDDVLKVADVEVNYIDQTGAKKKEVMTSAEWKKTLNTKTLPLTEGIWAKITPKASVPSGDYQLKVTTAAAYLATLADGKKIADAYGNDPDAESTPAKTAEEVAAWCAQSPTAAFTVSKEGYAKEAEVDFGGNHQFNHPKDPDKHSTNYLCVFVYWIFDWPEEECTD